MFSSLSFFFFLQESPPDQPVAQALSLVSKATPLSRLFLHRLIDAREKMPSTTGFSTLEV
jgi:hypothetical protein